MRFIVDTQVWLWWHAEPEKLGPKARALLEDENNEAFLSAASVWEIAIKYSVKKLPLPEAPREYVSSRIASGQFSIMDITANHALECAALPMHHKDPFDRILVSQAMVERISILTADRIIRKYAVEVISATT